MNGKQIQDAAVKVARMKGFIVAHFTNVQDARGYYRTSFAYDAKGFPDLVLLGWKLVVVECKGDGDSIRPDQRKWLAGFEQAGIETLVLTSKLWKAGALEELLDRNKP